MLQRILNNNLLNIMNNFQKRFLLFIFGCIVVRLLIVWIAKTYTKYLKYLGYIAILLVLGFIIIYIFGLRKTGRETMGEKIWWNSLRPVHGILWGIFAFMAIRGDTRAWIVLLIDVIFGLLAFLIYHYREGDFSKLFIR